MRSRSAEQGLLCVIPLLYMHLSYKISILQIPRCSVALYAEMILRPQDVAIPYIPSAYNPANASSYSRLSWHVRAGLLLDTARVFYKCPSISRLATRCSFGRYIHQAGAPLVAELQYQSVTASSCKERLSIRNRIEMQLLRRA